MKHVKQILLLIIIIALLNSPLPAYSPDGPDKVPASDLSLVVAEAEAEEMAAQKRVETNDDFGDDSNGDFDDEFEDEYGDIEEFKVFDPLSGYNRFIVGVNDKLYFWMIKPLALGYQKVLSQNARTGVNRFFNNLLSPIHIVNNVLQLKFRYAGEETLRFVLNTTVGVLGFWDPAMDWYGIEPHYEDFGQTLGHYGVGSGFHIVLPLWGHSNLRDLVSLYPDFALNPLTYADDKVEWGSWFFWTVNDVSLEIGEYETIKNDALDLYPFMRDTYEQKRDKEIRE